MKILVDIDEGCVKMPCMTTTNTNRTVNFVVGFGDVTNVAPLRQAALGWADTAVAEDDALPSARHLVAATSNGEIVGVVSTALVAFPNMPGANFGDVRGMKMWGFAVNPQYAGVYGIEEALLKAACDRARDMNVATLWGDVAESGVAAFTNENFVVLRVSVDGNANGDTEVRVARQFYPDEP